jgi:hypothetical protein
MNLRPDGTRVTFLPFPTPLFDEYGGLKGAVNILIDLAPVSVGPNDDLSCPD